MRARGGRVPSQTVIGLGQDMTNIGLAERVYPATKLAMVTDALIAAGVPSAKALQGTRLSLDELHAPRRRSLSIT